MIGSVVKGVIEGVANGANNIIKTVAGSEEQRNKHAHLEQTTLLNAYANEFAKTNRTWFDSLVDGINRLVRPSFTFGVFGLFAYTIVDPEAASLAFMSMATIPQEMWVILGSIVVFWFGSRFAERFPRKFEVSKEQVELAKEIVKERRELTEERRKQELLNAETEALHKAKLRKFENEHASEIHTGKVLGPRNNDSGNDNRPSVDVSRMDRKILDTATTGLSRSDLRNRVRRLNLSEKGLDFIKKWEGFRSEAYLCQGNVWTVGFGHTKGVTKDTTCTRQIADAWLRDDVMIAVEAVQDLVDVPLHQYEFDALVSFVFNLGETNFRKSTLLKKVNASQYKMAADEFPKWVYASGKKSQGLINRRNEERQMFLEDQYNVG